MFLADLHIHSHYSRATSKDCTPEQLDKWARRKGLQLVGTGDFTHPAWREELKEKLLPAEAGLFSLKEAYRLPDFMQPGCAPVRFVLSAEISSIYKKNGRVRKVHNVILLPSFEAAETLSQRLEQIGNLHSDGRPILGLDSRDLLEITLSACLEAIFIPAHIWTPHFSLFGAFSGFDTIEECFADMTPYIHAMETGLSSDPAMNLRLSALDRYHMISNSDAHSPSKLGREANLFDAPLSYPALASALADHASGGFAGTIEFFPEEGKYHLDGHRNCKLCLTPAETARYQGICPVCGKKITIGVLNRVEQLADRSEGYRPANAKPYESLVPLPEVIAASMGLRASTGRKVQERYETMLRELGNEFYVLREAPLDAVEQVASFPVAEGIRRMRCGQVTLLPGFDGEYGKIKLFEEQELETLSGQMCFAGFPAPERKERVLPDLKTRAVQAASLQEEQPVATPAAEQLNPAQQSAVQAEEPVVAVVAGPGTGKTKTLISRICYLIEEKGVAPGALTAVTFTNKAAGEMRRRLEAYFDKHTVSKMHIGTFHGICLRLFAQEDAVPSLIDPCEAEALAAQVLEEQSFQIKPKAFLSAVSLIKNSGLREEEWEIPPQVYLAYQQKLADNGVMDFDDVLLRGLAMAEEGTLPCFMHLLVDEFQDINPLQFRLVQAWARQGKSLFVIGDPDQSIYGFRGSDSACFEHLKEAYPRLRLIRLEENYRSAPAVLRCALPVITQNPGKPRALHANCPEGEPVQSLTAESDFAEAVYVANEINRMVGGVDMLLSHSGRARTDSNLTFSDIAVLYRTHKQSEALEYCLKQEGIPYLVAGRDKTLEQPEVRGILSFFRSLLFPADLASRRTCLRLLLNGGASDRAALERYAAMAGEYRPLLDTQPPKMLLERLLSQVELPEAGAVEKLLCMAVLAKDMPSFLSNLLLGQERDLERAGGKDYTASSVTLMTLHAAKGLEYPVVFLCGARKGLLPLETERHPADLEEERRLFYVGMTRAKEQLVLLHSGQPSCFLADLPEGELVTGAASHQKNPSGGKQLSLFD